MRSISLAALIALLAVGCTRAAEPPYPPSVRIPGLAFDWRTHERGAPGSDNWPLTWGDDDLQYTSWGDGGGFGGDGASGRVSLGVARIEGGVDSHRGSNRWGGRDAEIPATFGGKSYGLLSVGSDLFMWVSPGSNTDGYESATLYRSRDRGASWEPAPWQLSRADGLVFPTFLQFGPGYEGARDGYVYVYAPELRNDSELAVQRPGEIALLRAPAQRLMERDAYEFYAGLGEDGQPRWSADPALRAPVFRDPAGVGWNASVSYNAGLGRYLLATEHSESFRGNLGIFDAAEPWGPWTTVLYENGWDDGGESPVGVEPTTFFWNFSNKWASRDGARFTLVFTGIEGNDSWNSVQGVFVASPVEDDLDAAPAVDAGGIGLGTLDRRSGERGA